MKNLHHLYEFNDIRCDFNLWLGLMIPDNNRLSNYIPFDTVKNNPCLSSSTHIGFHHKRPEPQGPSRYGNKWTSRKLHERKPWDMRRLWEEQLEIWPERSLSFQLMGFRRMDYWHFCFELLGIDTSWDHQGDECYGLLSYSRNYEPDARSWRMAFSRY